MDLADPIIRFLIMKRPNEWTVTEMWHYKGGHC